MPENTLTAAPPEVLGDTGSLVSGTATASLTEVINAPILWIFALAVFGVIFIQTAIYMRAALKAGPQADVTKRDLLSAYRAGGVASIGPSLAVVLVAIALLALFGTPAVLIRIGLIGSAATETASAGIAATSMGAQLGGESYTPSVFAVAFAAMSLSGGMWMIATLILTPILKRGEETIAKSNPAFMLVIPAAALLGAFSMLTIAEAPKSHVHLITLLISAGVMAFLLWIAKVLKQHWLKEWALGFAILIALVAANFIPA